MIKLVAKMLMILGIRVHLAELSPVEACPIMMTKYFTVSEKSLKELREPALA